MIVQWSLPQGRVPTGILHKYNACTTSVCVQDFDCVMVHHKNHKREQLIERNSCAQHSCVGWQENHM